MNLWFFELIGIFVVFVASPSLYHGKSCYAKMSLGTTIKGAKKGQRAAWERVSQKVLTKLKVVLTHH